MHLSKSKKTCSVAEEPVRSALKEPILEFHKVAAVVVLFNPDNTVYDNIISYIEQVDLVIIIDNSEKIQKELIDSLTQKEKIIYIANGCNLGIAAALNLGAKEALSRGYGLLLTMDQDSRASKGMVDVLRAHFLDKNQSPLGIVSPFHLTSIGSLDELPELRYQEVDTVWTSGNILNLSAFEVVGPFEEGLFIDFVDHEYCLRLKRYGYRIVQSYCAVLHHRIGNNLSQKFILWRPLFVSNHLPLRRYYITRNRFYVRAMYPEFTDFCRIDRRRFWAELVTVILFEKQKIEKLKMVLRGYNDYRLGRLGKLDLKPLN